MDPIARMVAAGAAGAGGGDPTYVDDVFSTFLYEGTGSSRSINNGIDLSGEGGLVWIKRRTFPSNTSGRNNLYDTERGATKAIFSNDSDVENTRSGGLTAFNSNGFTLGHFTDENGSGNATVSWTFRKAPGFFDVVTYTGNSTAGHTISHSLGSVPGMIIIKNTSNAEQWQVWHRSVTGNLELDNTGAANTSSVRVDSVTSTSFNLTSGWNTSNANGQTYVAYIFAHDDQSFGTNGDESIIKCGSYTGDDTGGNPEGNLQNLGFEPQWLLIKNTSRNSDPYTGWHIFDNMRGVTYGKGTSSPTGDDKWVYANKSTTEETDSIVNFTPVGFSVTNSGFGYNCGGDNYIYMAIRRPNKPPTDATEVFAVDTYGGILPNPPGFNAGFTVDMALTMETAAAHTKLSSRLTQGRRLFTGLTNAEDDNSTDVFDYQDGWNSSTAVTTDYISCMFRRAPGFFDVVSYTGTNLDRTVNHNLGVAPEFMIIKNRNENYNWVVYHEALGNGHQVRLPNSNAKYVTNDFNSTSPTSSVFTVGSTNTVNESNDCLIAYLFASLAGISKVGSYTGTGSNIDVDCGFTAGARFVLIKRTDSTGDWYVWDTLRGIVSGNDPYKLINTNDAQVTNTDYIDPLNAGFTVTSSAPTALNASGGEYMFLAIA